MQVKAIFVRQKILRKSFDHLPVCIMKHHFKKFHLSPSVQLKAVGSSLSLFNCIPKDRKNKEEFLISRNSASCRRDVDKSRDKAWVLIGYQSRRGARVPRRAFSWRLFEVGIGSVAQEGRVVPLILEKGLEEA
jgi:hypothetical protein